MVSVESGVKRRSVKSKVTRFASCWRCLLVFGHRLPDQLILTSLKGRQTSDHLLEPTSKTVQWHLSRLYADGLISYIIL